MYIRAVAGPGTYPIDLALAKQFCRVSTLDTSQDDVINAAIAAAVGYAERVTGRSLTSRPYVATLDQFPQFPFVGDSFYPLFLDFPFLSGGPNGLYPTASPLQETERLPFTIALRPTPVTAITKIVYIDLTGNSTQLNPGTDFVVDLTSDPARVGPIPGGSWPQGIIGLSNVQVFFTAGFDIDPAAVLTETLTAGTPPKFNTAVSLSTGLPGELKAALLILTNEFYTNRELNVAGGIARVPQVDDILSLWTKHDFTVDK